MSATDELTTSAPKRALMLPEIAGDAYAHVTHGALLAMEKELGDGFSSTALFASLDALNPSTIQLLANHALKNATLDQALEFLTLEDLARRLADALSLCYHGRTVSEQIAKNDADALAEFERIRRLREAMGASNVDATA